MDRDRFDDLTRRLATGGTTRRRLLRDLGGSVAGAVLVGLGVRSTQAVTNPGNGLSASSSSLVNQSGGICDNCSWMCANCNIACCGALGSSHFKPRHP
jgi:hypothetical protein